MSSASLPSFTAWCLLLRRQLVQLANANEESSSLPSFTAWCLFSPRQLVKLAEESEESSSMPSFTALVPLFSEAADEARERE